jgi:hypothetical protein
MVETGWLNHLMTIESIDWEEREDQANTVTHRRATRLTARAGLRRWYAPWTRHPHWYASTSDDGTRYLIAYGWAPLRITD